MVTSFLNVFTFVLQRTFHFLYCVLPIIIRSLTSLLPHLVNALPLPTQTTTQLQSVALRTHTFMDVYLASFNLTVLLPPPTLPR